MPVPFKQLTDYLRKLGTDEVSHTEKTYLAHVIGVYRDLQAQGYPEDVVLAGMFHSIYGTELFQRFSLPLDRRQEVRDLIGERAERIAYLNCAMDRASFDHAVERGEPPYRIVDRLTKEEVAVSPEDFDDLCRVHLYDWLEQVGRSRKWDYRRDGYRRLALRLGGHPREAYEAVFAQEVAVLVDPQ